MRRQGNLDLELKPGRIEVEAYLRLTLSREDALEEG